MTGLIDSVDQRTRLVGQNRLELLLFRLGSGQLYGINVFKVKEVLQCPRLTAIPQRKPVVRGVAHIRGSTVPILDMNVATGQPPLADIDKCYVIITEYNRSTQGFLVSNVEQIINTNWENIHPPPRAVGSDTYLTAVTETAGRMVAIVDVEKILAEVSSAREQVSDAVIATGVAARMHTRHLLIVDDSSVARRQIQGVMQSMGLITTACEDGRKALQFLQTMVAEGKNPSDELILVISDIEMPEMDGYTFTAAIRADPRLCDLHIILHTSLSGVFNKAMIDKVGANDFLAKFNPDELAQRVNAHMLTLLAQQGEEVAL